MYMSSRVGEEIDAVITGVEHFGIFCQGVEIPVEGMVHVTALPRDDFYDHDSASISLIGRRTGKEYRLGDPIRVVVAFVDVYGRLRYFRVVPDSGRRAPSTGRRAGARSSRSRQSRASNERRSRKKESDAGRDAGRGDRRRGKSKRPAAGGKRSRTGGRKRRR